MIAAVRVNGPGEVREHQAGAWDPEPLRRKGWTLTSIIHDGASAVIPANRDYDYDGALKFIAVVRRAVDSADFHAGVVYGYTDSGRPAMAAAFTAAVEERREFDAIEAEFAATDDAPTVDGYWALADLHEAEANDPNATPEQQAVARAAHDDAVACAQQAEAAGGAA